MPKMTPGSGGGKPRQSIGKISSKPYKVPSVRRIPTVRTRPSFQVISYKRKIKP